MIVSASYRTDIPAFYGRWFMNRLDAGCCDVLNSYKGKTHSVSLLRQDVDGLVFWTKNFGPFLEPYKRFIGAACRFSCSIRSTAIQPRSNGPFRYRNNLSIY